MSNILYIINPASHGGAGTRAWEEFRILWSGHIDSKNTIVTKRPGHAREIAVSTEGYDMLAAVGGDGTVGDVMSGIMDRQGPHPGLAVIPTGTGNDIARNAGICSIQDAVGALRDGCARSFDLMRVDCQVDGHPAHRHAFIYGIVGFSSIPMVKPWMKRLLGPKGAYYLGALLQIIVYRVPNMTIHTEKQELSGCNWMVIVGNSEKAGGNSMCLAPGARIDDGELNITIIPSKSKLKMITGLLPKISTGAHIDEPGISYFLAKRIEINSDPPAILELDGDVFGTTPATFTVCPGALQVMTLEPADRKAV